MIRLFKPEKNCALQHFFLDIASDMVKIPLYPEGKKNLPEANMMEPIKIAKQTIEFYKTNFDNSFNAMMMLQEQTQRIFNLQLAQTAGLPDEGKKVITEWLNTYKKGVEEFKAAVDESFKKLEAYFAEQAAKTEKK